MMLLLAQWISLLLIIFGGGWLCCEAIKISDEQKGRRK